MKFKCLTCGELVEWERSSWNVSVAPSSPDISWATKTETHHYTGVCLRCGTRFSLTAEQESVIDFAGKKEGA